jgi:hypothetical protein
MSPFLSQGNTEDWTVTSNATLKASYLKFIDNGTAAGSANWHWLPWFQRAQAAATCATYRAADAASSASASAALRPLPQKGLRSPRPTRPTASFEPFPQPFRFSGSQP